MGLQIHDSRAPRVLPVGRCAPISLPTWPMQPTSRAVAGDCRAHAQPWPRARSSHSRARRCRRRGMRQEGAAARSARRLPVAPPEVSASRAASEVTIRFACRTRTSAASARPTSNGWTSTHGRAALNRVSCSSWQRWSRACPFGRPRLRKTRPRENAPPPPPPERRAGRRSGRAGRTARNPSAEAFQPIELPDAKGERPPWPRRR